MFTTGVDDKIKLNYINKIALFLFLLSGSQYPHAGPQFVHLAEGFTSPDTDTGIRAAQRNFSVPDMPEICLPLRTPNRLVVVNTEPLQLVRGQWFGYERIVVLAVDASGAVLAPVPVSLEVEDVDPPVLNLRSDMTADPEGRVLPIRSGSFHIRFTTLCNNPSIGTVIKAVVQEP